MPKSERRIGFDGVGVAERGGGSHPTVPSHMKLDGVVEVFGVIHEGDAFVGVGGDGSRVINPASGFAEAFLLVDAPFGVGDASATVVNADGFCHADSEESEGGCAEDDGVFWCNEFGIDVDAPEARGRDGFLVRHAPRIRGRQGGEGDAPIFGEDGVAGLVFPKGFEFSRAMIVRIFESGDVNGFDGAPVIGPEGGSCDVVMADPNGVMMRVADGVMGMSHAGERDT